MKKKKAAKIPKIKKITAGDLEKVKGGGLVPHITPSCSQCSTFPTPTPTNTD